jgi:hypothetical protein
MLAADVTSGTAFGMKRYLPLTARGFGPKSEHMI